jgi:starch-binding outer membrane protein, SusD/RagB family
MKMKNKTKLISLLLGFTLIGCDLDVDNPNSLLEGDLQDPSAAAALANGAWNASLRGVTYMMMPHAVATDESVWIGSRDAWYQIDKGGMTNVYNEFVDQAWPYISEARWMSDKAVEILEGLGADLPNNQDLVLAYLSGAMVRVYIADMFEDFVYSDKTEAGTPVGAANMSTLYDEALALLGKASSIATGDNAVKVLSLVARTRHAKAVWGKVNPVNTASPYVSAGASEAAAAAAMMTADWKWRMNFSSSTVSNYMAGQINDRQEMDLFQNALVETATPGAGGDPQPNDPVTGLPDSRMTATATEFRAGGGGTSWTPVTITSLREMHLIIAESKKAGGDDAGCLAELNALRTFDSLDPYPSGTDAGTALQHERRANLFLQSRRLSDMYRFNLTSTVWDAVEKSPAGSFFPITISEIRSNPNISQ